MTTRTQRRLVLALIVYGASLTACVTASKPSPGPSDCFSAQSGSGHPVSSYKEALDTVNLQIAHLLPLPSDLPAWATGFGVGTEQRYGYDGSGVTVNFGSWASTPSHPSVSMSFHTLPACHQEERIEVRHQQVLGTDVVLFSFKELLAHPQFLTREAALQIGGEYISLDVSFDADEPLSDADAESLLVSVAESMIRHSQSPN